ncbi:MAG: hypothetical protein HZC54_23555 [Verrucomicrobia bacterium]|nr:hypothetical protein [Verrucomicrobiota bacterium]
MSRDTVYDKGKHHLEQVEEEGLSEDYAVHHIAFFMRWLVENSLVSEHFLFECADDLDSYKAGKLSLPALLWKAWDGCLAEDMLSDKGNAFARDYFDYKRGTYLTDLQKTLCDKLPNTYHIPFTEENWLRLKPVIDERYQAWQKSPELVHQPLTFLERHPFLRGLATTLGIVAFFPFGYGLLVAVHAAMEIAVGAPSAVARPSETWSSLRFGLLLMAPFAVALSVLLAIAFVRRRIRSRSLQTD